MSIEEEPVHIAPAGGDENPGQVLSGEQPSKLQDCLISEKLAIKNRLMLELATWIDQKNLKQAEAAKILGVSRPRVSDVINKKSIKFTIDALVDMLDRIGKHISLSVR
jgi:predicted XRE-type DNA-binding protein